MVARQKQVRLALTLFDAFDRLWNTVATLIEAGIGSDQLCLLAAEPTMPQVQRARARSKSNGSEAQGSNLAERVEPWPALSSEQRIFATSGPLLECMTRAPPGEPPSVTPALLGTTFREIADSLADEGVVALVVRSIDSQQQSLVTRTLLTCSTNHVMTFEFRAVGSTIL